MSSFKFSVPGREVGGISCVVNGCTHVEDLPLSRTPVKVCPLAPYRCLSTAFKYSKKGSRGTNFVLINEVALGTCAARHAYTRHRSNCSVGKSARVTKISPHLTRAPDGFDSVHGVRRRTLSKDGRDVQSDFTDDEFCVYDRKQQCIRYLIEVQLE